MPQAAERSRPRLWPLRRAFVVSVGAVVRPALNTTTIRWLRHIPSGPAILRRRYKAPRVWWPDRPAVEVPADLRSHEGVRRDEQAAQEAFDEEPLHSFHHNFGVAVVWALARLWQSMLFVGPRLVRAVEHAKRTGAAPTEAPAARSPQEWTDWVRDRARRIGMSTVGFAAYDERYTFAEHAGEAAGPNVIVCVLEQEVGLERDHSRSGGGADCAQHQHRDHRDDLCAGRGHRRRRIPGPGPLHGGDRRRAPLRDRGRARPDGSQRPAADAGGRLPLPPRHGHDPDAGGAGGAPRLRDTPHLRRVPGLRPTLPRGRHPRQSAPGTGESRSPS